MSFNFPNSPATGQTYIPAGGPTYTWDGIAWKALVQGVPVTVYVSDTAPVSPAIGQLWWNSATGTMAIWYADADSSQWVQVSGQVTNKAPIFTLISSSGTYTKPAGLVALEVGVMGGGGGGGPARPTAAAQYTIGGGGGGGCYGIVLLPAAMVPDTVAMTIGASGAAGNGATSAPGGTGGTTSFGTLFTATGGTGGGDQAAAAAPVWGYAGYGGVTLAGSATSLISFYKTGEPGQPSWLEGGTSQYLHLGNGGGSFVGVGGIASLGGIGSSLTGVSGSGAGSGGSGACNIPSSGSGRNGGAGAVGMILLREYF